DCGNTARTRASRDARRRKAFVSHDRGSNVTSPANDALDHASWAMLDVIQRGAFQYFLEETDEATGLVRDKTAANWPASIAAVGLALTVYPVGVERNFISRG